MPTWTAKKAAFEDNLTIWNTLGHIQLASIEMKQYTKRLSADNDKWEKQDAIKAAYIAIYETSEKLIKNTGTLVNKQVKFLTSQYVGTCKSAYTKGYALN